MPRLDLVEEFDGVDLVQDNSLSSDVGLPVYQHCLSP